MNTFHTRFALRPLRRSLTVVALAGVLAPAASAQPPATTPASPLEAVDAYVQKALTARSLPGASVAVVKDGKLVVARGYGFSDVETQTKATEQTIYQLASVTKPFTAMATLMLAEDGKLALDGKITEILPGLPAAWSGVTVRHLLSHTSGIKSYTEVFGSQKIAATRVFTPDEILALVKDTPLQFAPGERYAYCNTGYYLLGMIVEKTSKKRYADVLAERIFVPLGMTSTSLDVYDDARPQRAKGYAPSDGKPAPADHTHPSQPFSAGALVSTVVDLAKWDAALTARTLLKPASYDAMWTAMRLNDGTPSSYALGWDVAPLRGRPRQAHGGGITGFSTFVARYPADKVTVIVLVNQAGNAGGVMANGIAEIFIPALAVRPTDGDPKTTAFLKEVITAAARGETSADWMTPDFFKLMVPDRIKEGPQLLGRHGALTAFDLVEESTRDGNRVRVYRAVFGTTPIRTTFVLNGEGKIAGLRVEPGI